MKLIPIVLLVATVALTLCNPIENRDQIFDKAEEISGKESPAQLTRQELSLYKLIQPNQNNDHSKIDNGHDTRQDTQPDLTIEKPAKIEITEEDLPKSTDTRDRFKRQDDYNFPSLESVPIRTIRELTEDEQIEDSQLDTQDQLPPQSEAKREKRQDTVEETTPTEVDPLKTIEEVPETKPENDEELKLSHGFITMNEKQGKEVQDFFSKMHFDENPGHTKMPADRIRRSIISLSKVEKPLAQPSEQNVNMESSTSDPTTITTNKIMDTNTVNTKPGEQNEMPEESINLSPRGSLDGAVLLGIPEEMSSIKTALLGSYKIRQLNFNEEKKVSDSEMPQFIIFIGVGVGEQNDHQVRSSPSKHCNHTKEVTQVGTQADTIEPQDVKIETASEDIDPATEPTNMDSSPSNPIEHQGTDAAKNLQVKTRKRREIDGDENSKNSEESKKKHCTHHESSVVINHRVVRQDGNSKLGSSLKQKEEQRAERDTVKTTIRIENGGIITIEKEDKVSENADSKTVSSTVNDDTNAKVRPKKRDISSINREDEQATVAEVEVVVDGVSISKNFQQEQDVHERSRRQNDGDLPTGHHHFFVQSEPLAVPETETGSTSDHTQPPGDLPDFIKTEHIRSILTSLHRRPKIHSQNPLSATAAPDSPFCAGRHQIMVHDPLHCPILTCQNFNELKYEWLQCVYSPKSRTMVVNGNQLSLTEEEANAKHPDLKCVCDIGYVANAMGDCIRLGKCSDNTMPQW